MKKKEKAASAVSVIGGADGPTSIFLAGKIGGSKDINVFRRMKMSYQNWIYRRKGENAKKQIVPGAHSLSETIQYMQERYNAVEVDNTYPTFESRKREMKFCLIQREQPELIGADRQIPPPENFREDTNALQKWMQEVDAWTNHCMKLADTISEDVFQMDYHLYHIDLDNGATLDIETEAIRGLMQITGVGHTEKVMKDIYLYYGVTQEDIDTRSDRYHSLLAVLSR